MGTSLFYRICCSSVTRPLTPTPMYTTCRAMSPLMRRLNALPMTIPSTTNAAPTAVMGRYSAPYSPARSAWPG